MKIASHTPGPDPHSESIQGSLEEDNGDDGADEHADGTRLRGLPAEHRREHQQEKDGREGDQPMPQVDRQFVHTTRSRDETCRPRYPGVPAACSTATSLPADIAPVHTPYPDDEGLHG
jgi:hypothetical protein